VFEIAAIAGAVVAGGLFAGWVGWGGWIIAGSVAWLLLSPAEAIGMAQVTTKAIDLVLIFAVSGQIEGRRIARIMLWLIPTMILGALFAAQASAETLKILAAGLILLGVFPAVWAWAAERTSYPVLGSLAGLFTTTSGFNGPPLALALQSDHPGSNKRTLGVAFVIISLLALPILFLSGVDDQGLQRGVLLGLLLTPLAAAATWLAVRSSKGQDHQQMVTLGRAACGLTALGLIIQSLIL
jgi:uncharacterized membrane protein YfcA